MRVSTISALVAVVSLAIATAGGRAAETALDSAAREAPAGAFEGDVEPEIVPAPDQVRQIDLGGARVVDLAMSPLHPTAAVILAQPDGSTRLAVWELGAEVLTDWATPPAFAAAAVAWHPRRDALLLLGRRGGRSEILRLEPGRPATVLHAADAALRRLTVGPRPFQAGDEAYRLFFGQQRADGGFEIGTVTDAGARPYTVITADPPRRDFGDEEEPHTLAAPFALPVGFHPAGNILVWEDAEGCFHRALYKRDNWDRLAPLLPDRALCGGAAGFTPNGAALLHWPGPAEPARFLTDRAAATVAIADGRSTVPPAATADGRGIVTATADGQLRYQPTDLPLADVVNAWMFVEHPDDRRLLTNEGGLLRRLDAAQLYSLYESELYYCGGLDQTMPTRPYLVSTDIFWELYAAAFEGLMVTNERSWSIPAFRSFLGAAAAHLAASRPDAAVTTAFRAAQAVLDGTGSDPEAGRIRAAAGIAASSFRGQGLDYRLFRPHGHYASSPDLAAYFAASRYLMEIAPEAEDLALLAALPETIRDEALAWTRSYAPFVASSRRTLVWDPALRPTPVTARPIAEPALFPRAWGIDNEALEVSIFHADWPEPERIDGRLLPDGLEVPAVLGSPLADAILARSGEFARHPKLAAALARARDRRRAAAGTLPATLYQRWLDALAVQWQRPAIETALPGGLWPAKRLQTGLASWATLRHATLLVNETAGAQCGEGGFELIRLRPPRGYVEPDPETFRAIAGLFEATMAEVAALGRQWQRHGEAAAGPLADGIGRRLAAVRDKALLFAGIADKQRTGTPRSDADYDEILYVGRVAEHALLVFKSLARTDFALANPDPIDKIAEVASDGAGRYLLAAVGQPLQWDQVVPFFGRRQVVKGVAYSYHALQASQVPTDAEWAAGRAGRIAPAWIAPLITDRLLSCPPLEP